MESEETMELRDLPVDTRNYTIIDNITGKPIEQSNYSLTIDPEVIGKLNELKKMNEEKVRQASLKSQYGDNTLVDTFTPTDNSVFTPVYEGEYIDAHDYNDEIPVVEETQVVEEQEEETVFNPTEVIQQDTILDRVVARDPSSRPVEEEINEDDAPADTQTTETPAEDNSVFNPEKSVFQQASEQIVNIDADKLGPAIKPPKHHKDMVKNKISLDKMEIREARKFAWLGYLLFFLPLLFNRKNRFARIHANEGLELNIMEIFGALLIAQYFFIPDATGTLATVSVLGALLGVIIVGMCALTIIPMMISAMCGKTIQTPWLWKKRIIKVKETRE